VGQSPRLPLYVDMQMTAGPKSGRTTDRQTDRHALCSGNKFDVMPSGPHNKRMGTGIFAVRSAVPSWEKLKAYLP